MKLFQSAKILNLELMNRIVMAPMGIGGLVNFDGSLSKEGIEYFVRRAEGGAGLIQLGFTRTNKKYEIIPNKALKHLVVDDRIHISWLSKIAEAVHDYDAKICIQLSAGVGRIAGKELQLSGLAIGPSKLKCFWAPHIYTRELTEEDIEYLIQSFQNSAQIIQQAGFDAIGIHSHEGYLLDQFISPLWNQRTDLYGGSLENRLRFPLRLIQAIKQGAGDSFPVIYRFGLQHNLKGGREIEESIIIAKELEKVGVDALDIDSGCYETWYLPHPPSTIKAGLNIELAAQVKQNVSIPVIVSGKLGYPNLAEKVLQENKADFISLGRPLLADPDWPKKVNDGEIDSIRYCIGCHEGCLKRIFAHKHISCAVNPATGNEEKMQITKASRKKKVLVIGGGIAGLETARVSALRGHLVDLWEKNDYLGGNFRIDNLPIFKSDYRLYLAYLIKTIEKLGVTVSFNKYAQKEAILEFNPDVLFLATGSSPVIPDIPGINEINYYFAKDIFRRNLSIGQRIVIIGGGLIGCETALYLAGKGKEVTLIEQRNSIGNDFFLPNKIHILKLLGEANVQIYVNTSINKVYKKRIEVIINKEENVKIIKYDDLILACGSIPDSELYISLADCGIESYNIGDCITPGKVMDAVWKAYRTARLV